MTTLRFVYKMTSELTQQDIQDILTVLNAAFLNWDETLFQWKYLDNPYGDSLHMIAYENSQSVGSMGFWRNDLDGIAPAYQCVDLAVIPSHQRKGIFKVTAEECVQRLQGAYLYTFPNVSSPSFPGFLRLGWLRKKKMPISIHLPGGVLRYYEKMEPVPDEYAEWRFAQHPSKQYHVYHQGGQPFLLSRRRNHVYIMGGMLSNDFGLPEVSPRFFVSYDFPDHPLRVPRRDSYLLEYPGSVTIDGFIPRYRSDTL